MDDCDGDNVPIVERIAVIEDDVAPPSANGSPATEAPAASNDPQGANPDGIDQGSPAHEAPAASNDPLIQESDQNVDDRVLVYQYWVTGRPRDSNEIQQQMKTKI